MGKLNLRQIQDVLHGTPGLTQSYIQQGEYSVQYDTPIKKQGGDGREQGIERKTEFRVCLWTGAGGKHGFADITREKLGDAMREAFAVVKLNVPEIIADTLGL